MNAKTLIAPLPDTSQSKTGGEDQSIQKKESDLDLRVIDIFGALLTTKLLLGENQEPDRLDFKLSEQSRFLKGGRRMMPIYTAYVFENIFKKRKKKIF